MKKLLLFLALLSLGSASSCSDSRANGDTVKHIATVGDCDLYKVYVDGTNIYWSICHINRNEVPSTSITTL